MRRGTETLLSRLDEAVTARGGDWATHLETAAECAWTAEVRVTRFPNVRGDVDRSAVFYHTGGEAEDALVPALTAALAEVEAWDMTAPRPATWDGR